MAIGDMAADQRIAQPQRADHVRSGHRRIIDCVAAPGGGIGFLEPVAVGDFAAPRERDDHQRADQREHADPRMNEKGDEQIDRHPGCVEHAEHRRSGQRLAQRVELAHRLARQPLAAVGLDQSGAHDRGGQRLVDLDAGADEQPRADRLHRGQRCERNDQDDGQEQQGHAPLRGHDAVVDLEHVEHRRDEQQVEHCAEQGRISEVTATSGKGRLERRTRSESFGYRHDAHPHCSRPSPRALPLHAQFNAICTGKIEKIGAPPVSRPAPRYPYAGGQAPRTGSRSQ